MNKNTIGIISAIVAVIGLAFVSSWMCLFPLGAAFTLAVIGLFGGKDKDRMTPFIGMLVSIAGILIMCQFAGFIPTFGFKPIGIAVRGFWGSSNSEINSREDALNMVNEMTGGALEELDDELRAAGYQNGIDGYESDSSELADGGSLQSESSDGIDWSMNSGSNDADAGSVVGQWRATLEGHVIVLTFEDGGTGTMQAESMSAPTSWVQNGRNLTITYYNEEGFADETEEFSIEINGDTMTLKKPDGSMWQMTRI